jgi:hypothetical protein
VWTGLKWLRLGSCGRQFVNTVMGSIKCVELLVWLSECQLVKKDPASWGLFVI